MERRREPRSPAGQTVSLIILDASGQNPDRRIPAELTEISGKGARLRTHEHIKVGAAVRVNLDDSSLLGEVCHCTRSERGYLCGVEIDQVISCVRDLARLMEALLGTRPDERLQAEPHVVRVRVRR